MDVGSIISVTVLSLWKQLAAILTKQFLLWEKSISYWKPNVNTVWENTVNDWKTDLIAA